MDLNKNINRPRTTGIRIEGGSKVFAKGNTIEGFDDGISVDESSELTAEYNIIRGLNKQNIDDLKAELIREIDTLAKEAKSGKDHKMNLAVNFLSQIGSGTLLGYLKSKGYIE